MELKNLAFPFGEGVNEVDGRGGRRSLTARGRPPPRRGVNEVDGRGHPTGKSKKNRGMSRKVCKPFSNLHTFLDIPKNSSVLRYYRAK